MHPFFRMYLRVAFYFLLLWLLIALAVISSHWLRFGELGGFNGNGDPRIILIAAPCAVILAYGLFRLNLYEARTEKRFITEFLMKTLEADKRAPNI